MSETALELIHKAKADGSRTLDLRGLELTSLPEELGQLTQLETLRLGGYPHNGRRNHLTSLPDWLVHLKNLRFLSLSSNQLTALPDWLGGVENLQYLDLSNNQLTVLPGWQGGLTSIRHLDLSLNQLTALPDWLRALKNLQYLDLSDNWLTALPDWLADPTILPWLTELWVAGNPLSVPPPEIMGAALTELAPAPIDAIRSYFRQLRAGASRYFYEAKVLIIGEGGAGKTSLARKLVDPRVALRPDERSTEGIEIITWSFPVPSEVAPDSKQYDYVAKVWDFGGQEIYFATHQFFLTKRSVYLLVADTRRQHTDFYTWLLMQETFGGDSPVILIKNRNRKHGNSFYIENILELRDRFPNLQEPLEVDLNEVPGGAGWNKLLARIQEKLLELPHIQEPRPTTWVAIRQAIGKDTRSIIPRREFFAICRDHGIREDGDIQGLGEYMHNLGDILYFHEDPVLRNYVILKPRWGLDAVYKVLDNRGIEDNLGKFTLQDLQLLWDRPEYVDYHHELLRLMANFQLCYELPGKRDTYIAPQLLDEAVPAYEWDATENLQLRYEYPIFMPRGILSRAIVKLHKYIEDQLLVWRSGVVLYDRYARAEILELRNQKQIRVRVSGGNKRDLLMEIVRTLDDLHRGFPKLQYNRLVPCNCPPCCFRDKPHYFVFDALWDRLANGKHTIECNNPPYETVAIQGLLSETGILPTREVELSRAHPDLGRRYDAINRGIRASAWSSAVDASRIMSPQAKKSDKALSEREKVFISYSNKDKRYFDELITNLKSLERIGRITTWSDNNIEPGAPFMDEIRAALETAKVALLLVSPDFLASDFIHHHELEPLLQKAESQGVRLLWVPVRTCAVKDTPLSRYQAVIPASKPLADMSRAARDKALLEICEQIKQAVGSAPAPRPPA